MRSVPKQFELGGHTIRVVWVDDLVERTGDYGLCDPEQQVIQLQTPNKQITRAFMLQVFLHELTHMILHQMGETELYENERFVDGFSHMLHQFLKTKKHT